MGIFLLIIRDFTFAQDFSPHIFAAVEANNSTFLSY